MRSNYDAVLFDFDGTISTLRCGWEKVMGPLFEEILDDEHIEDIFGFKYVDLVSKKKNI